MFDLLYLTIHIEEVNNDFFIYCTSTHEQTLSPEVWKDSLFLWHAPTYYGITLHTIQIDGKEGILLSPWESFTFFISNVKNHILKPTFSQKAKAYQQLAYSIKKHIEQGNFQRKIDLQISEMVKDWIPLPQQQQWQADILRTLIQPKGHQFMKQLGLIQYEPPFELTLRLVEPSVDGDGWRMETLITPNNYEKDPFVFSNALPDEWAIFETFIIYEHEKWKLLAPTLQKPGPFIQQTLTDEHVWKFLNEDSLALVESGVSIHLPSWWNSLKKAKINIVASTFESNPSALFGLQSITQFNWSFSIGTLSLNEEQFKQLVEQKRRLLKMNGQWIQLDPKLIKQAQRLVKEAKKKGVHIQDILKTQLAKDVIRADQQQDELEINFEISSSFHSFLNQLTDISQLPIIEPPSTFHGTLRSYQQHGLNWLLFLRKFGLGGCLADDMGLGKTIQLIGYLTHVHTEKEMPSLIICPTSLIGNWKRELKHFAPSLDVYTHYGQKRLTGDAFDGVQQNVDVVITTYQLALQDYDLLVKQNWNAICLDEAQHIKNPQTKQARAIRQLQGKHKIALTGTPVENRLTELWSIFEFINPHYLGSLTAFKKEFVTSIEKEDNQQTLERLNKLISPFLLRRTKKDHQIALDLPDKQEQKEYIPLTIEQASLYEQLVHDTLKEADGKTGLERKGFILQMLTKLKLLCNHPALYLKESANKQTVSRSYKVEKIIELVQHIRMQNESCLIFTQYIETGFMLQRSLQKEVNEDVIFLHGSLSKEQRDEFVSLFQTNQRHIFILSLRAGGTGLNLTAANHVIHFDRWWNPAVENQATDRAHRIGQTKFVHVHKFITLGTIEEKIDTIIDQKQLLNEQLIQHDHWLTQLSPTELKSFLQFENS
ncbi:DEAD/DEAH box helicase [Priestia megaterium]|nr:DEAD/DEAH box helicase [Priestia megaterium]